MPENLRGATFFNSPCTFAEDNLSLYSKVNTGECTETYDVFIVGINIRRTCRFMQSLQPPPPTPTPQKTPRICANLMTHPGRGRVGTCPPVPTRGYATGDGWKTWHQLQGCIQDLKLGGVKQMGLHGSTPVVLRSKAPVGSLGDAPRKLKHEILPAR